MTDIDCVFFGILQGQDVLSEKLRSFSMQDLTLIQNEDELLLDGTDDTHIAATLPRAKPATRTGNHTPCFSHTNRLHCTEP